MGRAPIRKLNQDSAVKPESTVIISIRLDEEVYNTYSKIAQDWAIPVEVLLADRLALCQEHNSSRPVYFTDAQRLRLEGLTNTAPLHDAEAALTAISRALTVDFGEVNIQLSSNQKRRLALGCRRGQSPAEYAGEIFLREVRKVAGV